MKKKISVGAAAVILVSAALFSFDTTDKYFEIAKNLDIFATLFKEVNTYYVDDVNPSKMMEKGVASMLKDLDPYTNYIPEDRIEDYRRMTTGQYGGIGATVGNRGGLPTILMPYEGFPAYKAGLKTADKILKIDDIDVKKKNTNDISNLLRGEAGTKLTLTIQRHGESKPLEIEITRERIQLSNVPYYGMVTDKVGMIQLTDFTRNAGKEVEDALTALKEKGAEKIILDLRGNPGGLLTEAVNISNIFIPKGSEVVSTKGKVPEWNKTYKALSRPADTEIPLVVLTSSSSASASEIVSGVIQDYDRGVVIGQNSFGKGLVQATRSLSYNSKLKVTVAKYYTPSGRCIQAVDYSHRNEDGSVGKVPDSLRVAFETANGRTVYDGGGIKPDIETEREPYEPITISLLTKSLIFDYATEYFYAHSEIADPRSFSLTDEEYKKFTEWLSDKDYEYTTKLEKMTEDLEKAVKEDDSKADVKAEFEAFRKSVMKNKAGDLYTFKTQIREALEKEIASRYYAEDGEVEASFDDDPEISAALELFKNPDRYKKILNPGK